MPAPNPIAATGIIVSRRTPRAYNAALPNGKPVIAHLPARLAETLGELAAGARVRLELTHYDFSAGRVTGLAEG